MAGARGGEFENECIYKAIHTYKNKKKSTYHNIELGWVLDTSHRGMNDCVCGMQEGYVVNDEGHGVKK